MIYADIFDSLPWPLWLVGPLIVAVSIGGRYLVIAGGYLVLLSLFARRIAGRRLQPAPFTRRQILREMFWSLTATVVFTGVFVAAFLIGRETGIFRIYWDLEEKGWLWFWASVPAALLLHDFYFYWTHRAMHLGGVYERVHKVHHLSTNPSPLAAFAFHPLEAVVEAGGFLLILLVLPMHPYAFMLVSLSMMVFNALGHGGYEIFPKSWRTHPVLGWLNTATAHNQHHRTYRYNFGLYTLIWDRVFGTLHPRYAATYDKVTAVQTHADTN